MGSEWGGPGNQRVQPSSQSLPAAAAAAAAVGNGVLATVKAEAAPGPVGQVVVAGPEVSGSHDPARAQHHALHWPVPQARPACAQAH